MFTGIISHLGRVESIQDSSFTFSSSLDLVSCLESGISIAINGVCLTVEKTSADRFSVTLMPETLERTIFQATKIGEMVNLELPVKADSLLSGHIVQGHVDDIGVVSQIKEVENSHLIDIELPRELARYVVNKGSIAVNGVSLTVIEASVNQFQVGIIPYTWENTGFKQLEKGAKVNLEVDCIAKYLEKLLSPYQERNVYAKN